MGCAAGDNGNFSFGGEGSSDPPGPETGIAGETGATSSGDSSEGTGPTPESTSDGTPSEGTTTASGTSTSGDDGGNTGTTSFATGASTSASTGGSTGDASSSSGGMVDFPDPIVAYDFSEGSGPTVQDRSGFGAALDLTVSSQSGVTWNGDSLILEDDVRLTSGLAATKLFDACQATNQLTIEAWVEPANLNQGGPARVVTFSDGTSLRNFTLGQDGAKYIVRLRTTQNSDNGTSPQYEAPGAVELTMQHVVFTRTASGDVTLYVDGVDAGLDIDQQGGDFSGWDDGYELALGGELDAGDRFWHGELFHVAIYDQAWSASEVMDRFAAGEP